MKPPVYTFEFLSRQELASVTEACYQNNNNKDDTSEDLDHTAGQTHHGEPAVQHRDDQRTDQTGTDL